MGGACQLAPVCLPQTSPVTIRVFEHKYNWLTIISIQRLDYFWNEEEY